MTAHVLGYSGGKDSTAAYLLALESGRPFRAIFADTGHEAPATYDYVGELAARTGGPEVEWVRGDFAADLARKRRTVAEKWPAALQQDRPGYWVLRDDWKPVGRDDDRPIWGPLGDPGDKPADNLVADPYAPAVAGGWAWQPTVRGLTPDRAAEVVERALEVLQPTGVPFLDLCLWKGRFPSTKARFCTEQLKYLPFLMQVVLPLREAGQRVIWWQGVRADESKARAKLARWQRDECGAMKYRPLLRWTVDDVFAMHRRHGLDPNPLYRMGCGRVGCLPCIHARKGEIAAIFARFPEAVDRLREWERLVGIASRLGASSFFSYDKTPGAHLTDHDVPAPGIDDVALWAKTDRGGRQFDLIQLADEAAGGCSSLYGLCE